MKTLAIGILPHPLCNPMVKGCGFCTFPHEPYSRQREHVSVRTVIRDITKFHRYYPTACERRVTSMYFGGGTANLTSIGSLRQLFEAVKEAFPRLAGAEVTLEGVPSNFTPELLEFFHMSFPGCHTRISMGIQTFDERILDLMGRTRLNRGIENVVREANALGLSCSADLLFNLPGQDIAGIKADARQAIDLGLKHICFYHLVCFEGLGTAWSEDPLIIDRIPSNDVALSNWLSLHEYLARRGYGPTTVTDFRYTGIEGKMGGTTGRYVYEEDLRAPDRVDWLGFGPCATSVIIDERFRKGIKLMNPESIDDYVNARGHGGARWTKEFRYNTLDLKLYWLTRQIKGTCLNDREYVRLFNNSIKDDFGGQIEAILDENLLAVKDNSYELTPRGMFFADSIAGLLASDRVVELTNGSWKYMERGPSMWTYSDDPLRTPMG